MLATNRTIRCLTKPWCTTTTTKTTTGAAIAENLAARVPVRSFLNRSTIIIIIGGTMRLPAKAAETLNPFPSTEQKHQNSSLSLVTRREQSCLGRLCCRVSGLITVSVAYFLHVYVHIYRSLHIHIYVYGNVYVSVYVYTDKYLEGPSTLD